MPVARNLSGGLAATFAETNVYQDIPYSGPMYRDLYQRGFRCLPGEDRTQVLQYQGRRTYLRRILKSSAPMSSYQTTSSPCAGPLLSGDWGYLDADPVPMLKNKSWDKLVTYIKGDTSSLGASAAEARESFSMIASRVGGVYKAYKTLRKGDFRAFLKLLSVDPRRKHRSWIRTSSQDASALWLEYWFGWAPMLQDMWGAIDAMTVNPVLQEVRAYGTARSKFSLRTYTVGNEARRSNQSSGTVFVKQGGIFRLTNENLFLANRVGLINPASIAWEVLPFSFVVDWFTGLGNAIDGFTDLAGLSYDHTYTTEYWRIDSVNRYWNDWRPGRAYKTSVFAREFRHNRKAGLSRPTVLPPRLQNFGSSLTRAASAVSLLIQLFIKK